MDAMLDKLDRLEDWMILLPAALVQIVAVIGVIWRTTRRDEHEEKDEEHFFDDPWDEDAPEPEPFRAPPTAPVQPTIEQVPVPHPIPTRVEERRVLVVIDEPWPVGANRTLVLSFEQTDALESTGRPDQVVVRGTEHPEDFGLLYRFTWNPDPHDPYGTQEVDFVGRVEIERVEGDVCVIRPPVSWKLPDEAVDELYQQAETFALPVDDLSWGQATEWLSRAAEAVPSPREGWRREAALARSPTELLGLVEEAFAAFAATRDPELPTVSPEDSVTHRLLSDERVRLQGNAYLVFVPELPQAGFRGVIRIQQPDLVPVAEHLMDLRAEVRRLAVLVAVDALPPVVSLGCPDWENAPACPQRGRLVVIQSMRRIFGEWVEFGIVALDPVQLAMPSVRGAGWSADYRAIATDEPVLESPPPVEPDTPPSRWPDDPTRRTVPMTVPLQRRHGGPRWPTAHQAFWLHDVEEGLLVVSDGLSATSETLPNGFGVEVAVLGEAADEIPLWQGLLVMGLADLVAQTEGFAQLLATHGTLSVEMTADFRVAAALPTDWQTARSSVGVLLGLPLPGVPERLPGDVRVVSAVLLHPSELEAMATGRDARLVLGDRLAESPDALCNVLARKPVLT